MHVSKFAPIYRWNIFTKVFYKTNAMTPDLDYHQFDEKWSQRMPIKQLKHNDIFWLKDKKQQKNKTKKQTQNPAK